MNFHTLLQAMIDKEGSDLFLTAGKPPCVKAHGRVEHLLDDLLTPEKSHEIVLSLMSEEQREEFLEKLELNFAIQIESLGRFRVNAFRQRSNTGAILRRIVTDIPTLEKLNVPSILADLIMEKRGLILMVGATGAGKSSTLAAMIDHRNRNSSGHIISIEDPIEFLHDHKQCIITQREVGLDTESFDIALKNTLRQAPDVILIGEIRSRETMDYAITFSETGHLCLATLHANNANQALDRIVNFFPEERKKQLLLDLSLNLVGVCAQQLIPTKDGLGRRAAVEVMLNTPLIADKIREGEVEDIKELMKKGKEMGMQTFDGALFDLYCDGSITYKEALKHADSKNELRLRFKLEKGITEESDEEEKDSGTPPPTGKSGGDGLNLRMQD